MKATRDVVDQLIDAREALNMNQAAMVRRSDWSAAQLSAFERCYHSPSLETVARYVAALGVDVTITIRTGKGKR